MNNSNHPLTEKSQLRKDLCQGYLYNMYNHYGITEYKEKWKLGSKVIYASRNSVVYDCYRSSQKRCRICLFRPFARKKTIFNAIKIASLSDNEIYCLSRLSHPNIMKSVEVFKNQYGMLIVLPYYPSGDLMDVLSKYQLTNFQKTQIAIQLVNTIAFLHRHEIAHGDIKIENIMMEKHVNSTTTFNRLKAKHSVYWKIILTDFGLSVIKNKIDHCNPPESSSDPFKSDIWNLGIVLLRLFGMSLEQLEKSYSGKTRLIEVSLWSDDSGTDTENIILERNPFEELFIYILERDPTKRWTIFQCQEWMLQNQHLRHY